MVIYCKNYNFEINPFGTMQNIFVTFSPPSIFRGILHHYNLLTYSMTIERIVISGNNDIITLHTIFLTKYEIRIQRRSNKYQFPPNN